MTLNAELLTATLAAIEAQPERHNQGDWIIIDERCGTTMCFAGHVAVLSGQPEPTAEQLRAAYGWWYVGDEHVADYAARALGLSPMQADALFLDCGTIDHLRETVAGILAGEIR